VFFYYLLFAIGGGKSVTRLSTLPQQDGDLTQVEVDKVLRLVSDVATEVAADDAMPCWVVFLIKLFLDVGGNILFDVELLKGLGSRFDGIALHVLRHVSILDDGLAFSHDGRCARWKEGVSNG